MTIKEHRRKIYKKRIAIFNDTLEDRKGKTISKIYSENEELQEMLKEYRIAFRKYRK